ncbi:MAG: hypothetical protein K6E19_04935 [Lachnospiraceae bacterium]|nr:hypothetical protein [Lachnospiraceae bacterium]
MLKDLKPFAKPFLYRTGLLKQFKKLFPMGYDGVSMEEGRVYTYTDMNYSISAAFDFRVGDILYQQNSLSINLSHQISLFANVPFLEMSEKGSPCYWIGSAMAGRAIAYKNFGAIIFNPQKNRFGIKKSHLFFPVGLFDEIDLSGRGCGVILGRTSGVNVCVRTNPGVYFIPKEKSLKEDISFYQDEKIPAGSYSFEYDLMNETKGYHYYTFEVDNRLDFAEFCDLMRERKVSFSEEKGMLEYESDNTFKLSYKGPFLVDNNEFKPDFNRLSDIIGEFDNAL